MNLLLADELVNGLLVFVIGMLVVFLGMTVIVLIVTLIGKVMQATTGKEKPKTEEVKTEPVKVEAPAKAKTEDEVDDKVKAAIFAAIAAYYFDMGSGCEFKVKRIKRI